MWTGVVIAVGFIVLIWLVHGNVPPRKRRKK
jgi:hypothetical protein